MKNARVGKTRQVMELCAQRGLRLSRRPGARSGSARGGFEPAGRPLWHIYKWGGRPGFRKNTWVSESCLSWEKTIRVIEVLRRHPVIYDMYVSEGGVSETRLLAQLEEYGIPERECAYIRATRRAVTDMVEYLREKNARCRR